MQFSTLSDVWAFGILAWEIITRGLTPYGELKDWKGLSAYLDEGNRLKKPVHCDKDLYNMMMHCWEFERKNRPTFSALSDRLNSHYKALARNVYNMHYNMYYNYMYII